MRNEKENKTKQSTTKPYAYLMGCTWYRAHSIQRKYIFRIGFPHMGQMVELQNVLNIVYDIVSKFQFDQLNITGRMTFACTGELVHQRFRVVSSSDNGRTILYV